MAVARALSKIVAVPALAFVCWGPLPLAAQTPTPVSLRPTQVIEEGLDNPHHAMDDNEFSASGTSKSLVCHADYCTTPLVVARNTWFAFPEGKPLELRVKWRTSAHGLIYYDTDVTEVRAKIEYSLGGGWIELESFKKTSPDWCTNDPTCGYPSHEKAVALPANLDTSVVKVRATLEVELKNCLKCTPIDSTNVAGLISVYDIRILADPAPKQWSCPEEECGICKRLGAGGASPAGGGPGASPPGTGPGALLRYAAGGAGGATRPGAAAWNETLGRYWSHDYAERIVPDPDESRVWLITRGATFRKYSGLAGGVYGTVSPSDEERTLHRTANGWELHGLDGSVAVFDAAGLWLRTTDANGNAKTAAYSGGRLASVTFPDGRREDFAYHASGKLASITEVGVGGGASRTWTYTWSGNDLTRVGRPDGTAWEMVYGDARYPGYLTRLNLVSTGGVRRIESAWSYDFKGNVIEMWRGDIFSSGTNAVDRHSFVFDNAGLPGTTTITDSLGKISTYTFGRDNVNGKPRLAGISGECPTCGLGPNTQLFYDDPAHPLRATREVDAAGTTTLYSFDANGRMTAKTEAAGTPLERTTTWQYAGPFPDLPTRVEVPSTSGSGFRVTALSYDAAGNLVDRTEVGVEGGSAFSHTTTTTSNAAGQPLVIDPPGYGTQDQTVFTYDPARGGLVASSRTDPLAGTTTFEHDPFNRVVRTTDPNGVVTETSYDLLDRVTRVVQKGATAAEDLVTTYTYNTFGDLLRTTLPAGNVIEYGYDAAGRLISVERKPNATTPGERTFYTLDRAGNRTREELQRWSGSAWVTESSTDSVYTNRCQLDKVVYSDGTATEYAYDCEGRLQKVWDANHPSAGQTNPATQVYAYDALGRVTAVTQPWSGAGGGSATTLYAYDVQGHLAQVTDANGTVTSFTYSDRDLLTQEVSEIEGVTTRAYNEHGQPVSETDSRGITVTRTLDALDRVTFVDASGTALDTTYTWDALGVPFSKGRLTAITRNGQSVVYAYDRFGRLLQDGALAYGYDRNGNRTTVTYPGGVAATIGHDFADRPATLSLADGGAPTQPLVTAATYKPYGPLSGLTLGNGLAESRGFTTRYFPASINVAGRLEWTYTADAEGNVTAITDGLNPAGSRTFAYQDVTYFLTQGDGPWGTRSWTYDRIGNRLTEVRDGVGETYVYAPNAAGGSSSRLAEIHHAAGTSLLSYDGAGALTLRDRGADKLFSAHDAEGRLTELRSESGGATQGRTALAYDGRGLLKRATFTPAGGAVEREAGATYSSDGVLHHRSHLQAGTASTPEVLRDAYILYFDSRPVALFERQRTTPPGGAPVTTTTLAYLTTDHLGTPVLATDAAGNTLWQGGFEPFGEDWNGAQAAGVFLRLPGQWEDATWENAALETGLSHNVNRWYAASSGRYSQPDPLGLRGGDPNLYSYALQSPISNIDPLGLLPVTTQGRPRLDIVKICGSWKALGCTKAHFNPQCECVCTNDGYSPRPSITDIKIDVYYASDCFDPGRIIREEMRHVRVYESDYNRAMAMAAAFSKLRFRDPKACDDACARWVKYTKDRFQSWASWFRHGTIDLTHPSRRCDGRILW